MLNKLSDENLNYIIGFLQGDGHHSESTRNRGKIRLELNHRDLDVLEKIKTIISPHLNVSITSRIRDTNFKNNSHQTTLTICNFNFRTAIKPYVPVGHKSHNIEPPLTLPNFSKKDYIRGLIDADGSIGISKENRPFISLCVSSEKIKEFLIRDIEQITGIKKEMNRNKRDNVYNIMLNNEEAIIYAKYLYSESTLYLDRKHKEYLKLISWVRKDNQKKRNFIIKKWNSDEDNIVMNNTYTLEEKITMLKRTKQSITIRIWRLSNNYGRMKNLN